MASVRLLTQELRRCGIITKRQILTNGRLRGGGSFSVGALHHLLRNRFYIGEVCYRGGVYPGEHPPILDWALFEQVQQKLANQAVERKVKRSESPALLTGLIFDDRGNRMTPSHANKRGVRYRYYVSQALLQGRTAETGSVGRVSAIDIEEVVLKGLYEFLAQRSLVRGRNTRGQQREHLERNGINIRQHIDRAEAGWPTDYTIVEASTSAGGRQMVEDHVERVIVRQDQIDLIVLAESMSSDLNSRDNVGTKKILASPDAMADLTDKVHRMHRSH